MTQTGRARHGARHGAAILDVVAAAESPARSLVRRWEDLPSRSQLVIVLPVAIVVLFVIHITLLNQPFWRGLGYGVFWGVLAAAAVLVATRTEKAKRERAGRPRPRS
jgi:hypothetical protein